MTTTHAETTSGARVVQLHERDNIAVVTADVTAGDVVDSNGRAITATADIASGHKIAVDPIASGETVYRYGQIIGVASEDIAPGNHVHLHNLAYQEFDHDFEFSVDVAETALVPQSERRTFQGYVRSDGKVGTRNYIGVLTTVNCSATAAKKVTRAVEKSGILDKFPNVDGVVALTHGTGCGMNPKGEGIELLRRVMHGYLTHPNFGGFVVLGLGCEDNQVAKLTKDVPVRPDMPIFASTIQELGGTSKTVTEGIAQIERMLPIIDDIERRPVPASELILGTNCGGSDSYSGLTANPALGNAVDLLVAQGGTGILGETPEVYGTEHMLVRRARTESVGRKLLAQIEWWKEYTRKNGGSMDNNPSHGNKEGGLTTILEKSLGAVSKGGTTTLESVVDYAEQVTTKGFVFMDTPGYDPVSVTGIVAGGANVVCFTTGRGSALGCAPVPSIKLATNTAMFDHMEEDMDINAGGIVDGTTTVDQLGREIFEEVLAVASGKPTKSEEFGYGEEEFVPWHIGTVM